MRKAFITATLLASFASAAFAKSKVAPQLENTPPNATVSVIVRWRSVPQASDHELITLKGGLLKQAFAHLPEAVYAVQGSSIHDLASDPNVAYIAPDRPLHGMLDLSAAAINMPPVLPVLGQIFNGTGITVAVLDSGMNANQDLDQKHILLSQDFTGEYKMGGNTADTKNAPDTFGHGQHVAGILASTGKSSQCSQCTRSLVGISPGVNLVNFRVLDENGNGSDSAVIAAIDEAIQLKDLLNIRVLNLSLGRPVYESYTEDPLCQAVEQAWKAGIVVVVAAGNEGRDNTYGNHGYGTITSPGNDPYVITVGAMKTMQTPSRTDDLIASYSSKGPTLVDFVVKPDLVAPGNQVVSLLASKTATLPKQFPGNIPPASYYMDVKGKVSGANQSQFYFNLSGTSMATPVVSAAVADLLQAQPLLNPDQVKSRLMLTAYKDFPASSIATDPVTGETFLSYYDAFTVGAGYLDLGAALASHVVSYGTALSPSLNYDATSDTFELLSSNSAVWAPVGDSSPFSIGKVWPVAGVDGQSVMWGQRVSANSVMWGQRIAASSVMWGQRIAATSVMWGQRISASSTPTAEAASVAINGEQ